LYYDVNYLLNLCLVFHLFFFFSNNGAAPGSIGHAYFSNINQAAHFRDMTLFYSHVSSGILPSVSFIKPESDDTGHPGFKTGLSSEQSNVNNILNTILNSARYANNTLVIAYPDESGGFYDHVAPPRYSSPIDNTVYGPRLYFLAMGNVVKKNYISHDYMEPASIIKFIQYNWFNNGTGYVRPVFIIRLFILVLIDC
jgi:phospholipase C